MRLQIGATATVRVLFEETGASLNVNIQTDVGSSALLVAAQVPILSFLLTFICLYDSYLSFSWATQVSGMQISQGVINGHSGRAADVTRGKLRKATLRLCRCFCGPKG